MAADQDSPIRSADVAAPGVPASSGGRLLICDDQELIRYSLSCLLETFGYQVQGCHSVATLLQVIAADPPDGIFLDVQLADEYGIDALRQIRQMSGDVRNVPVCVLSGSMNHREEAFDAGADEYLLKPSGASELADIAGRLLAKKAVSS